MNGITFNAFANLGYALQEAVTHWEKKGLDWEYDFLWADQTCIDQSNPNERSHQVGMMRDVYAGAAGVLICLDDSENETDGGIGIQWAIDQTRGFEWLELRGSITAGHSFEVVSSRRWDSNSLSYKYPPSTSRVGIIEKIKLWTFQQGFVAFPGLPQKPWWKRAWICREFINAGEADFISGGVSMP